MQNGIDEVREYWSQHLNCTQFLLGEEVEIGSERFFSELERIVDRYGYKRQLLAEFWANRSGSRLLEIGCGLGNDLVLLSQLGFEVTGIDLAPPAVEVARKHLEIRNTPGKVVIGNVEELEFADESFDAIYSSGVIQHTPDIEKATREMMRVLKSGGKMLIVVYHRWSWFYFLKKITGVNIEFQDGDAPIIKTFSKKELRKLFVDLRNVLIRFEAFYPVPTARSGISPWVFNHIFVPAVKLIPPFIMKNLGWHMVLIGTK
jgi:ubiquinone/menaquinone biosynthesis C-methylase UbiE